MQKLIVPRIMASPALPAAEIELLLEEKGALQKISNANWKDFPYTPDVRFRILHTGSEIWLKFFVQEKYIRAVETRTNGDVYKDSAVEFFVSFDQKNYYNLEFSCIGTIHLGYGSGRHGRQYISPEIAEQISAVSSLGKQAFDEKSGGFNWEMMLRIPLTCFVFDEIKNLSGLTARANFYKCGDATSEPHFISWNPIKTETPDYHQPDFFGEIAFE